MIVRYLISHIDGVPMKAYTCAHVIMRGFSQLDRYLQPVTRMRYRHTPRAQWLRIGALLLLASSLAFSIGHTNTAHAKPFAPNTFCEAYPGAPMCDGLLPGCTTCHVTTSPLVMNPFGEHLSNALGQYISSPFDDAEFADFLPQALMDIEQRDSDEDGFTNIEEIQSGTQPGSSESYPSVAECPRPDRVEELDYKICQYDYGFVYRKVGIDFCGLPPTFDEMQAFANLDESAQATAVHTLLDSCLDGEFWLGPNGVLWNIAHDKIRPVGSLSRFADYINDYEYFTYTQIDDHDVRDVLVGQYVVTYTNLGSDTEPRSLYEAVDAKKDQPMQPERRAGLLTTAWPLFYNTMFTALPRGTAAQAYRAFLGFDIAAAEGLSWPIDNEPIDYDRAGVTNPTCAACHSTLDPLSYPFSRYNGIQGDMQIGLYMYDPDRIDKYFVGRYPAMANMGEAGYIFGQPVADLLEWAQVAANSDPFFTATVDDYWKLLIGDKPTPDQTVRYEEYTGLALQLSQHFSVEQMLHGLIDTEAYGAP